ncbi:MAG: GNAT family N-acetyltransferase [Chloroflexi bacterium]|nr:GNAT family N-acetyltransferase [Chloroflexota bacterium]
MDLPTTNHLGQPIGFALPGWTPPPFPPRATLSGRTCRVEPLDVDRHAAALYKAFATDTDDRGWTYLPYGPFADLASFTDWLSAHTVGSDPQFYAIIDLTSGSATGMASYLRITPSAGSIEVGHIHYSPALKQTPPATEAMYLMMRQAFELGYRRYEWKCDALNAPSRAAAQRLGFSFEGIFRQATVYKGRNRDTAWYAIIDREWPALRQAFERWLEPENFDADGIQRTRLSDLTGIPPRARI